MMAARELSKFEQDTLVEALTKIGIEAQKRKLAEQALAIEQKSHEQTKKALETETTLRIKEFERARLAEDESLKQLRLKIDIEGRLASVNSQLDEAQVVLAAERRAHDQTQSQMTTLMAEIRKPVKFPTPNIPTPTGWRLEVTGRDGGNNIRTVKLVPEEK